MAPQTGISCKLEFAAMEPQTGVCGELEFADWSRELEFAANWSLRKEAANWNLRRIGVCRHILLIQIRSAVRTNLDHWVLVL